MSLPLRPAVPGNPAPEPAAPPVPEHAAPPVPEHAAPPVPEHAAPPVPERAAPPAVEPGDVVVRPAERRDMTALVELRLANAERHVRLNPGVYRIPDRSVVHAHFAEVLPHDLLLIAEVEGEVAGCAELVAVRDAPGHQILRPRRAADVHTVVLTPYRGKGVGRALLAAAETLAAAHGFEVLHAGIAAGNDEAVAFYAARGFRPRGTLRSKQLD
ncbi:GNAT family N-acetyltransferase [Actinoplanes sp. N902-109]|uniref:GNAT family N-acetyltransferase n=1 Tax=Actinoplanes sp. (strain N902-109) TaxID=649831 RepID=UPI0003293957|nr:GNAT family N-acetyltransferase [Actinoplanes sp. N902-109]AGL18065.1 phosphinothricin N-acetyltransferase, putative [Actinoplanes sp. N902-109]